MQMKFTLLANALALAITLPIVHAQDSVEHVPSPVITSVAGLAKAPAADDYQIDPNYYSNNMATHAVPGINATEALWDYELALKVEQASGGDSPMSSGDDSQVPLSDKPALADVVIDETHESVGEIRQEWKDQVLRWHNGHRANYGASALTWSDSLYKEATESSDLCQLKPKEAENLAAGIQHFSFAKAMKMWMDEASIYDYNRPGFSRGTGHFTQLIWKQTREVACIQKTCEAGTLFHDDPSTFVVCRYNPPGNYEGYFPHNVGYYQG